MGFSVGILGLIGSGKDTFGEILLNNLREKDSRFQSDSYARPLKELGSKVIGIPYQTIDDRDVKEKEVCFKYTDEIEDILYNFMDCELGFVGLELSEGLRRVRNNFSNSTSLSPRRFYQLFGTDVVRDTYEDAWVNLLRRNHKYHPVVVRDVRFENELCDINILVCRHEGIARPQHESEHLAWDIEFKGNDTASEIIAVSNRGSLEVLSYTAKTIISHLEEVGCI